MYPELITIPGLNYTVKAWGFMVVVGFVVALGVAMRRARRVGGDPGVVMSMAVIGGVLGLVGCRGMYVLHHLWIEVRSGDLSVRDVASMTEGGEIFGGILLAIGGVMVFLAATRRSIRLYLDLTVPPMILAMGIGRLGCLLAGCCFGGRCVDADGQKGLPWAVRFPYASPAYVWHWQHNELEVPRELLWNAAELFPQSGGRSAVARPALVPADLLRRTGLEDDEGIRRYLEALSARMALEGQSSTDPRLAELTQQLRNLRANLPGRNAREKVEAAALVQHLHNLDSAANARAPTSVVGLGALAAAQHSDWVHPTQIYDFINLVLLFFVLSAVFQRRRHHGIVVAWALVLYSASRFVNEAIRADNPRDIFDFLTVSQLISLLVVVAGLLLMAAIVKLLPARSPRAPAPPAHGPGGMLGAG